MASLTTKPARRRGRFHPLTVIDVGRLTADAVAVSCVIPDELAAEFAFEPGQHLTLRKPSCSAAASTANASNGSLSPTFP